VILLFNDLELDFLELLPTLTNAKSGLAVSKLFDGSRSSLSLRGYLALIVISILVPLLLFAAILFSRYYYTELARIDDDLRDDARELALAIDRDLQGQLFTLRAMSLARLITNRDFAGFYQQALKVREFTGVDILLRDSRTNQQLVNTRVPWGTPLPVESVPGDDQVIATKKPYISGVFVGAVAQRPLYTITVPVLEGGDHVAYFLQLSLELERLVDLLNANILPDRAAGIVDRDHRFLARTRSFDQFVGKRAPESFIEQTATTEGYWRGVDAEGEMVRAGFARSKLAGWWIWVSTPERVVQNSLRNALWTLGAVGAALTILAVLVAYLVGGRLAGAIGSLSAQADALGRGESVSMARLPVRELDAVSRQLVAASAQRKALEEKLVRQATHASEQRFQLLVQGVTDYAIFMLDPGGHITNWNPGAARIKGYTEQEVVGKHFSLFYTDEDRKVNLPARALQTAVTEGKYETEGWRVRKGGVRFWANVVIDPIRNAQGELLGFAKITRDITEKREAQRQLDAARDQLYQAQKMDAVGQLTGGVAHDFNNLLTIIIGNLDHAKRTLESWQEGAQVRLARAVDHALVGARRAATLTSHLLAFARRQPLETKPLDVNKLLNQTSEFLKPALGEAVELEVVGAGGAWQIEADRAQLETAILNLALNARGAMPDGGKLTIEASNVFLDEDYCSRFPDVRPGQYVQLSISDNGEGMTREALDRAFEPFFTTKQAGEGTGLGLSQVYGFVKQSGGHVRIYSEPGNGTTVKIYLPRSHASPDEPETNRLALSSAHGTETILVVEDDEDVRAFVSETLRDLNYNVIEARDAKSAVKALEHQDNIDLLLTDVILPGQNGRELARTARERRPRIKVLFMTGYSRNAIVHQGRLDHDVDLIQKPLTQASLGARIRDVLDRIG
jgi:PAS domain S-box-containing protein